MKGALKIMREEGRVPSINHPGMEIEFKEYTDMVGLGEIEALRKKFKAE
jgi:hypothetical protein